MISRMTRRILTGVLFCVLIQTLNAQEKNGSYKVETIPMPEGLTSETGGVEFLPDGRLVACFTRGEVMTYEPSTKKWKLFAEGLHDPLGILVVSNSELLIIQRPELTRVKDTDGDGTADLYEKVTDDFGFSGNYHEFNYGPVKDKDGNLFIALNSSSGAGNIRPEVRGEINPLGRENGSKGQMFSNVPYRGWVMKLSPDGVLKPFASGFRSPNGIGFDLDGNLFATDNQGDWIGTSPLHHVQEGKFYGHPASLVWQKGWSNGNPFLLPVPFLDSMRTRGAVLFPHGIMANSPTQPLCDNTGGRFGPYSGQLFIGEMNKERIVRVMLEKVGGEFQGACIPFFDGNGLRKGNNRLVFGPDGSLWIGQNSHGWLGDQGIQRIVFTGKQPADVYTMNLTEKGFDLTFTQPIDELTATDPANFKFRHYYYKYHNKYGSEQFDVQNVPVTAIKISDDRKKISLTLSTLKPGYVYELTLGNIKTSKGDELTNKIICYTLNKLKSANF
ncbi:Glucose/arabinose dehydrogenase, beta-propeller fold [Daejeonella rubra]|uniref:Glucose/arabinose dehydrogenase, beta-propeller fold n=2 Tax=Daejeonella rubra TaxID=990371 RepID=A0A1G9S417_9SPHI|nr:Glucose/arabinose dehydrogenase, beta-propeller fold [Daejeonella rubra]